MDEIRTLAPGITHRGELKERRSHFITLLAHAEGEQEARSLLGAARAEFPQARHHCSAFIVQVTGASLVERCSDDGEPPGTAGMPMLEVLRGHELINVIAVVVRYFGGIKLGTGGLVRTYSDAVREALTSAPLITMRTVPLFEVELDHADAGRIESELREAGYTIQDVAYGQQVRLRVATAHQHALATALAGYTGQPVHLAATGTVQIQQPLATTGE